MGASVSLLGWFSHDKDPNFSIVVPLEGIQRLIRVLSFSGVVLLVMLRSSPPSLSLLLGVIRGFGLSFGFQESA